MIVNFGVSEKVHVVCAVDHVAPRHVEREIALSVAVLTKGAVHRYQSVADEAISGVAAAYAGGCRHGEAIDAFRKRDRSP